MPVPVTLKKEETIKRINILPKTFLVLNIVIKEKRKVEKINKDYKATLFLLANTYSKTNLDPFSCFSVVFASGALDPPFL